MPRVLRGPSATILGCAAIVVASAACAQSPDRNAIWTANRRSVIKVKVTGRDAGGTPARARTGSGVIVRSNGVAVTAAHVVGADAEWFEIPGGGGARDRQVEVFALDGNGIERSLGRATATPLPPYDAALLTITANGLPAVALADGPPDDFASVVALLWDPEASQPEPVTGDLVPTDRGRFGDRLTVRLAVVEGNSGSGLFTADGKLTGLVTNQLGPSRALAVPAYVLARYLPPLPASPSLRASPPASPPTAEATPSCEDLRTRLADRQAFKAENGVRCESMGAVREDKVEYVAPPGYAIVGQVVKEDRTNYGTVGPVQYRSEAGHVAGASAALRCATPMRPFGPGGWADATLTGFIERIPAPVEADRISRACRSR